MKEAGAYIGQSYRWMQRHYVYLVKSGVIAFRVPKDSPKGRLVFEKGSLDRYMESCQITADFVTVESPTQRSVKNDESVTRGLSDSYEL